MQSKKLAPKLALAALSLSGAAFAQTAPAAPEPDYSLSANVALVSDYRFRGIAQTSKKPALQGGVDFSHKSGFYAGTFLSNVKWVKDFNGATKGGYEWDLYGGFKKEVLDGFTLDVGLITYRYPGNNSGDAGTPGAGLVGKADTNEWYLGAGYKMFTLKYNRTMGNLLGVLNSGGSSYWDLSAGFDLGNGLALTPHIGHQTVRNTSIASYTDYSLTLAKDFGNGFSASAAYVGSNARRAFYTDFGGRYIGNDTVVVGVKYTHSF
ncbi:TorF family putative porin [Ramlibacter sp. PS4R-6]|uniref:TorF family putative porin n=1 Tax=Ramlibacter sp. PS4R-6 TaxID=3133438 RepID=UPI0030AEB2D6